MRRARPPAGIVPFAANRAFHAIGMALVGDERVRYNHLERRCGLAQRIASRRCGAADHRRDRAECDGARRRSVESRRRESPCDARSTRHRRTGVPHALSRPFPCRCHRVPCRRAAADRALAQTPQPGEVSASASLSGIYQFDTDLDHGGDFHWAAGIASGTRHAPVHAAVLRRTRAALRLRGLEILATRRVRRRGAVESPQRAEHRGRSQLRGRVRPRARRLAPSFGWAFESGAKTSDALTYGAILAATKVFSPSLMLGVGVGIVRQIDETQGVSVSRSSTGRSTTGGGSATRSRRVPRAARASN